MQNVCGILLPGCVPKHKTYKGREYVRCDRPFERIVGKDERPVMEGIDAAEGGTAVATLGSAGPMASTSRGTSEQPLDIKIEWIMKTIKEIKDEIRDKSEIKEMIRQIIRELISFKQELEEMIGKKQEKTIESSGNMQRSYSELVKEKEKESIVIIKPKIEQESTVTKKLVKEKVDIKNLPVGITKVKKRNKGSIILGCESEREIKKLKEIVQEKLGKDFDITEPRKRKPKLKIINISDEIMKMDDVNIIETIERQNEIEVKERGYYIRIAKKIIKERRENKVKSGGRGGEEGLLIIEVDKRTQELISRGKINIGWRKCRIFDYVNVKRCLKMLGILSYSQELCKTRKKL